MALETLVVLSAFTLYFFAVLRPTGLLTANAVFVYLQLSMAVGTLRLLNPAVEADAAHGWLILVTYLVYLLVSAAATLHRPPSIKLDGQWAPPPRSPRLYVPKAGVALLILFSLALMLLYFQSVGYSALIEGLRNTVTGGDADVAGLRLASYAGDVYFAPGYVNQFKNALLPALLMVTLTYWIHTRRRHILIAGALVLVTIFGLTGTGQRGAFVDVVVVAAFFVYLLYGRRFSSALIRLGVGAFAVMMIVTAALGREPVNPGGSLWEHVGASISGIVRRVLESQQVSSIAGFRYIYSEPVQWGSEWWTSLRGLLPGQTGSDLSNRIFATLYGGSRGTSPPSIWGSAYHNFGWVGAVVFAAAMALVLVGISRKAAAPISRNTLELVGIAGTSVSLGVWSAGGPTSPLNGGLAVYLLLWFVGWNVRRLEDHGQGEQAPVMPPSASHPLRRREKRLELGNAVAQVGDHGVSGGVSGVDRLRVRSRER